MRTVAEALGRERPDEALGIVALGLAAAVRRRGRSAAADCWSSRPSVRAPRPRGRSPAAFVAFGTLQTVANAVLLGTQHFRSAALIGAVTGGVMVPLIIGVLAAGGGITGMFAVEAAVAAANLALDLGARPPRAARRRPRRAANCAAAPCASRAGRR